MSVEIKGLEEVLERLDIVAGTENLENALEMACAVVERRAKELAPRGTGELRRSITSKVDQEGGDMVGVVYTPLLYAPYVEYGTGLFAENGGRQDVPWWFKDDEGKWHSTSGMPPRPYMRPALQESREKILRILEGELLND